MLRHLTPRGAALVLVATLVVATVTARSAQQPQTPGQLRPRPAEGREPEFPPPSIREYMPRSTLRVLQHPVPRAKFPVVDIHGHPFGGPGPVTPDAYEAVVKFETNDEYFDYYRDYHAFWKLYGIGLPDSVLRKLYSQNAMKLTPGLPHGRFPS